MSDLKKRKYKRVYSGKRNKTKLTLNRLMRPEVKKCETSLPWNAGAISRAVQTSMACSTPNQGITSIQRVGTRIQVIGLRVKGSMITPLTQTIPGAARVRAVLVRFSNVNFQSVPAFDSIFDNTTLDRSMNHLKTGLNQPVKVLRDFVAEMDLQVGEIYNFDWYIKLNDIMDLKEPGTGTYPTAGAFADSANYGYALYFAMGNPSIASQDGYNCCAGSIMTFIDC